MIESPLIQELMDARTRQAILAVLEARFGQVPRDLAEQIGSLAEEERLMLLLRKAASCPDLEAFRGRVEHESSADR